MRFLLIGKLTPAVAQAVTRHEHTIVTLDALGLKEGAAPEDIFKAAIKGQVEIVTADADLANAPFTERIPFPRSLVFLQLAGGDVEQDDAIDRLFERYTRLTPRRLYTVTENRVKIRQLPGA